MNAGYIFNIHFRARRIPITNIKKEAAAPEIFESRAFCLLIILLAEEPLERMPIEIIELLTTRAVHGGIQMLKVIQHYFIELESALIRERRAARTDQLTGLPNRLAFDEDGERLYALATRHSQPLSMIVLDIDYFKSINDCYGHRIGDEVIKLVAEQIKNIIRRGDIAVRWGGEEFAVICPNTDIAGSQLLAERLRSAIEHARINGVSGKSIQVTASFGCAQLRCTDTTCSDLFERADRAMYTSKKNGRNQVHSMLEAVID